MEHEDPVCRLSLESYGLTQTSSWVEARETQSGFKVYLWAELIYDEPICLGTSDASYDWRLFARFLADTDEGKTDEDAVSDVRVEGENGVRADILKLAWSSSESYWIEFLVQQSDTSLEFLDKHLDLLNEDNDVLKDIADISIALNLECDLIGLFNRFALQISPVAVSSLQTSLARFEEDQKNQQERVRKEILGPFESDISLWAAKFSDDKKRIGAGMGGLRPTERTIVRKWLEQFVLEHRSFPQGEYVVSMPFLGGTISAGKVNFN